MAAGEGGSNRSAVLPAGVSAPGGAPVSVGTAAPRPCSEPALRKTIGRFQFFALGFGTIIGSAWVVVLGDCLRAAEPGGAILGFLAGGVMMGLMAAVYAELCVRLPEAGGEFVFAHRLFGPRVGFIVGWFIALDLIATAAFEAIALPWLLQSLFPALRGPVLYELLGAQVTLDAVVIGVAGVVLITYLNYRDVRLAVRFQSVITYGFLIVAVLVLAAGAVSGSVENLERLVEVEGDRSWWLGELWIFANAAFFLSGFQAIPQAIEERAEGISARTIGQVMVGCVAAAALFYCLVVLCSSLASPWQKLAGVPFATSVAVEGVLPGGLLAKVVLLAAAFSLLKTWNAMTLMGARILMAQARQSMLPAWLASIHPAHATPGKAVLFVGACTIAGLFLGRGAVLPLVNMAAICLALTFVLGCAALLKLRRRDPGVDAGFRLPGGPWPVLIAMVGVGGMSAIALIEPWTRAGHTVPLEWILMLGWAVLGLLFRMSFRAAGK